ncbi:hypothetical protein ACFV0D_12645 [Streptomyces sp. NPDC059556]
MSERVAAALGQFLILYGLLALAQDLGALPRDDAPARPPEPDSEPS